MQTFLAPEKLFFELPLLFAIVLTVIQLIGGLEAGHGLHTGVDHDVGHDIGHASMHGVDHNHEVGHSHEYHGGTRGFTRILGFLGFGSAPMFMVVAAFCYSWAFIGFASMHLLSSWLPAGVYVWWSVVITLLLALFVTRYLAHTLGFFFRTESYGVSMNELVGLEARTRLRITTLFGRAELEDRFGTLQVVECRIAEGEKIIEAGTKVILYQWHPEKGVFHVITEDQLANSQSIKTFP